MAAPADAFGPPIRIAIDANVWVAYAMSLQLGRTGTVAQEIVSIARTMKMGGRPAQLIVSLEMVDTVEQVLVRQGFSPETIYDFTTSIVDLMKAGPERLNPVLLLSGRDQIAISDREDAGVLASAIAAKANLLVTDNLSDFATNDSEVVETRTIKSTNGERRLFAVLHERSDGISLVVAHPADVLEWIRKGVNVDPESIRIACQAVRKHGK